MIKKFEVNHSQREFPYDAHQELEELRQEVNELQQRVEGLSNAIISS